MNESPVADSGVYTRLWFSLKIRSSRGVFALKSETSGLNRSTLVRFNDAEARRCFSLVRESRADGIRQKTEQTASFVFSFQVFRP